MYRKRKFGLLIVVVAVLTLALLFFTKTDFFAKTQFFVDGEGKEKIANVFEAIDSGYRFIVVSRSDVDEFNHIVDKVYDSPYLFWLSMDYSAFSVGDISVLAIHEKYDDVDQIQSLIENEAKKIINRIITDDMSEYDKVLAIHDWICGHIIYGASENDSDQDIYGALVLRKARCAGYAKAFTYLLDMVGVQSEVVSGESIDRQGNRVAHAWNLIYIDGKPYYFDVTWDDNDAVGHNYDYFGVTANEFKLSHFPNVGYEWADAVDTDACYYIKNGMYIESYTTTSFVQQIYKQGLKFTVKCKNRSVMREMIKAFENREEIQNIMKWADISYIDKILYVENKNTNCLHIEIVQ